MGFQKSAYSLRSRLHLGEVRLPALVGIAVIVVAVAVCIGYSMVTVANSQTFSVTHAQDETVKEETSEGGSHRAFRRVCTCCGLCCCTWCLQNARRLARVRCDTACGRFAEG